MKDKSDAELLSSASEHFKEAVDAWGITPLIGAIDTERWELVRAMLERGFSVKSGNELSSPLGALITSDQAPMDLLEKIWNISDYDIRECCAAAYLPELNTPISQFIDECGDKMKPEIIKFLESKLNIQDGT